MPSRYEEEAYRLLAGRPVRASEVAQRLGVTYSGRIPFRLKPVEKRERLRRESMNRYLEGRKAIPEPVVSGVRQFIEYPRFPFQEVSEASGKEVISWRV